VIVVIVDEPILRIF